jgi:hypothetical protein
VGEVVQDKHSDVHDISLLFTVPKQKDVAFAVRVTPQQSPIGSGVKSMKVSPLG